MFVAKAQNMRNIDKRAIEKYKIPGMVLMENAAWSVYQRVIKKSPKKVTVVCGIGNNGGDGFALTRLLYINGFDVSVYLFGEVEKIKGDAKINYEILINMGIKIKADLEDLIKDIKCSDITVDAIFGTGLDRQVEGIYKEVIDNINTYSRYTISIDIPSGICADTGEVLGSAVYAYETVTFGAIKLGLLLNKGREHTGTVIIENISIPHDCIKQEQLKYTTNYGDYPTCLLKKRYYDVNKGLCGKVAIIGGCYNMSGAVSLSTKAALRAGSGLVSAVVPRSIADRVASFVPEATYKICKEKDGYIDLTTKEIDDIVQNFNAIAIGVGMGQSGALISTISYLLEKSTKPMVIDADGLNLLCSIKKRLKSAKSNIILTPHPGEMSRLTGLSIEFINKNRVDVAVSFAKEYNCIVLLKGASTVVTDGDRVYINTTGNPGMATAGSGDVLTGIIVSFLGQGYDAFDATVVASFLHGLAGDSAYKNYGNGIIASDIIECVGQFLR